jgi:hypothetical protein
MKKLPLLTFLFLSFFSSTFAAIIVVEGKYQNENLYIQNGYSGNGVGYCAYEITVNGKTSTDEVNSSAFEIDFPAFSIKPGTPVIVEIRHKDDCSPKVLNPEALKAKVTFEVINIDIDKNGILSWSTIKETGSLPFIIEQYRWNKWISIGEINGSGSIKTNSYSFQTTLHSGENKFRVKQIGFGGDTKSSSNVVFTSAKVEPTYTITKDCNGIDFSSETNYEVFDVYGNLIKRGFENKIDISNLEKGNYYLCYDNIITDFKKK